MTCPAFRRGKFEETLYAFGAAPAWIVRFVQKLGIDYPLGGKVTIPQKCVYSLSIGSIYGKAEPARASLVDSRRNHRREAI